jgi:hypothetical protein
VSSLSRQRTIARRDFRPSGDSGTADEAFGCDLIVVVGLKAGSELPPAQALDGARGDYHAIISADFTAVMRHTEVVRKFVVYGGGHVAFLMVISITTHLPSPQLISTTASIPCPAAGKDTYVLEHMQPKITAVRYLLLRLIFPCSYTCAKHILMFTSSRDPQADLETDKRHGTTKIRRSEKRGICCLQFDVLCSCTR